MIKQIAITAPQKDTEVDADLQKYIVKKIGKLDKRLSKKDKLDVRADVKLRESKGKGEKKCTVEAVLHVSGTQLTATESTVNMYAAVDIVEAKLKNQLKRHKEKHSTSQDKHKNQDARRFLGKILPRKTR
jgi:putative sigma-54 modulation protein